MRGLLKFFAVLTWDWFACRDERHVNEGRAAVFDAHALDADTVAGLVADEDVVFQQMCFESWERQLEDGAR